MGEGNTHQDMMEIQQRYPKPETRNPKPEMHIRKRTVHIHRRTVRISKNGLFHPPGRVIVHEDMMEIEQRYPNPGTRNPVSYARGTPAYSSWHAGSAVHIRFWNPKFGLRVRECARSHEGQLNNGTRNPKPENRDPKPGTRNPEIGIRNPEYGTRNTEPETRNLEPGTRNPGP